MRRRRPCRATLRDDMAMRALEWLFYLPIESVVANLSLSENKLSDVAYAVADRMIEARRK